MFGITFTPEAMISNAPETIQPTTKNVTIDVIENSMMMGIYANENVEKFSRFLRPPHMKRKALETLILNYNTKKNQITEPSLKIINVLDNIPLKKMAEAFQAINSPWEFYLESVHTSLTSILFCMKFVDVMYNCLKIFRRTGLSFSLIRAFSSSATILFLTDSPVKTEVLSIENLHQHPYLKAVTPTMTR